MATTLDQIQEFLDEFDLRYVVDEERDAVLIGFGIDPDTTTYRDHDGDPHIRLVIRLMEDGEFLSIFCPSAWNVEGCPHKAAVFEAIAAIQGRFKLLRFDYDPIDGEIRPNVELSIEDAEMSSRQFHRLMHGIFLGVQRYDGVIRHAMQTGEVSFASVPNEESAGTPPPEVLRLQRLAEEAGGLEALEQVACGCGDVGPDGEASLRPERPAAERPLPKPVIRRIWERLFGPGDREPGTGRKAG